MSRSLVSRLGLSAAALAMTACAQGDRPGLPPPGYAQRVLLTTFIEWPSTAEVAGRVAQIGGVPVRDAGQDGPRVYRMTLACNDEPACRDAMQRLSANRSFVQAIERDARQRLPARPERDTSR
jgi:hypothetical protein